MMSGSGCLPWHVLVAVRAPPTVIITNGCYTVPRRPPAARPDRRLLARTEAFEALSHQLDGSTFFLRLLGPGEWGRSFAGEQDQRSVGSDVVKAAAIGVPRSPSVEVFVAAARGHSRGRRAAAAGRSPPGPVRLGAVSRAWR